jgi:dATP pyrophosphohydrolase
MRIPLQVLVYPLARTHPAKVLLLRRTRRRGGFWQGVTGAPFQHEELADAALRELKEETGFTAERAVDVDFSYSFPVPDEYRDLYSPDASEIIEHVFFAEVCEAAPHLSAEHDEWKWCSLQEAKRLLTWEGNRKALDRVYEYIAK